VRRPGAHVTGKPVIGTGDFTHPGWLQEIEEKLEPVEEGLFRLRKQLAGPVQRQVPSSCRDDVRFVLTTEISSIYKKGGQVLLGISFPVGGSAVPHTH
jgi:PHP family Zn ribbon phosphoesterase